MRITSWYQAQPLVCIAGYLKWALIESVHNEGLTDHSRGWGLWSFKGEKMKKYKKKPVIIEAVQWDGDQETIRQILRDGHYTPMVCPFRFSEDRTILKIITLEGLMTVNKGDYIIKGIKGEFYPCKPDIFKASYEEVDCE